MGKIVLNSCGPNKVKVIKIVHEATGIDLKDAKDAVEAVDMGTPFTMDVANGTEAQVIGEFLSVGANASNMGNGSSERTSFNGVSVPVSSEDSSEKQHNMSEIADSNPQTREDTLNTLYQVGKIAEDLEIFQAEKSGIIQQIATERNKADELRNVVSAEARKKRLIILLCSLLTWFIVPVFFTIVIWIIVQCTIIKKDRIMHADENNANAERYILEHVEPLKHRLHQVEKSLDELETSGKIGWAQDVVGNELFNSTCIGDLYDIVKNRRADSLKEALVRYDDVQYKARMEESQAAIQNATEVAAQEAIKQTAYSKEIAKSTHQAATAAKATAYHTRQTAYHTKQINKNTRRFR